MQFKTTIDVPKSLFDISHSKKGITMGSCFTTNIGNRLLKNKFRVLVNPLGTVYNPVSIANVVELLTGKKSITESDVFFANGVWQSYFLHTSFSAVNKADVLQKYNEEYNKYRLQYQSADYIIITLGTAWVYELKDTGTIVCNCHKTESSQFNRRRLSVTECVEVLLQTIALLRQQNSNMQVIFTISPIRHWKDGSYENQVSKSTLFLAVDEIIKSTRNVEYFPAYELLMDDLRDYRFYDEDMLHPNKIAIDYIWEKFSEKYFPLATVQLLKRIDKIKKSAEHRPFNSDSEEYKLFVEKNLQECEELQALNPLLDFSEEISVLKKHKD